MLCSTMLIKTIQYYDENGRQAVCIIMYYFWMQVKHSIVFVILSFLKYFARQKSMSPHCTIAMLNHVSQSGLLCEMEQQKFN